MDPDSLSKKAPPVQQTSPEEDATLLAIEALEAQSIDLDTPKPPAPVPAAPPTPVAQPVKPEVPVAPQPPKPAPTPPTPKPVVVTPPQPKIIAKPIPTPKSVEKPAPKKATTPAEKIAEALASDEPAPKRFQFFANQKPPRTPFIVVGIILVVIGLGVGAYVTLL